MVVTLLEYEIYALIHTRLLKKKKKKTFNSIEPAIMMIHIKYTVSLKLFL